MVETMARVGNFFLRNFAAIYCIEKTTVDWMYVN
jgi:hypothetical protein